MVYALCTYIIGVFVVMITSVLIWYRGKSGALSFIFFPIQTMDDRVGFKSLYNSASVHSKRMLEQELRLEMVELKRELVLYYRRLAVYILIVSATWPIMMTLHTIVMAIFYLPNRKKI